MNPYPNFDQDNPDDVARFCTFVNRERGNDITQFNSIYQTFIMGRKVGKIPTSSADVATTDRLGDVNWTSSYLYILVDNSGTPSWRRVALSSW